MFFLFLLHVTIAINLIQDFGSITLFKGNNLKLNLPDYFQGTYLQYNLDCLNDYITIVNTTNFKKHLNSKLKLENLQNATEISEMIYIIEENYAYVYDYSGNNLIHIRVDLNNGSSKIKWVEPILSSYGNFTTNGIFFIYQGNTTCILIYGNGTVPNTSSIANEFILLELTGKDFNNRSYTPIYLNETQNVSNLKSEGTAIINTIAFFGNESVFIYDLSNCSNPVLIQSIHTFY